MEVEIQKKIISSDYASKGCVPLDQALRASELNPLEQAVLSCAWKAPQQGIQHGWGEVWKF